MFSFISGEPFVCIRLPEYSSASFRDLVLDVFHKNIPNLEFISGESRENLILIQMPASQAVIDIIRNSKIWNYFINEGHELTICVGQMINRRFQFNAVA